jgi:hypothetical protein
MGKIIRGLSCRKLWIEGEHDTCPEDTTQIGDETR